MDNEEKKTIDVILKKLKEEENGKNKKLIDAIKRMISFSVQCNDCKNLIGEIENKYTDKPFRSMEYGKTFSVIEKKSIAHLQKTHKLVAEGYYISIYMAIGMTLGISWGLLFDNLAMGLSLGLALGLGIGSALDADAKKKNRIL